MSKAVLPMDSIDLHQRFIHLFMTLRQDGFALGIGELFAALKLLEGEFELESPDDLRSAIRLLWCTSEEEQTRFDMRWASHIRDDLAEEAAGDRVSSSTSSARSEPVDESDLPLPPGELQPDLSAETSDLEWTPSPVCAPMLPDAAEQRYELRAYWPISSRSMAYAWRCLRRPRADGPEDVLDIEATVERVARQRFFLSPVYRRRQRNHAHLLLLVDQGGSMTPMHRFSRDLIETAQPEQSGLEQVDVLYFQNVPGEYLYADPHLTRSVSRADILGSCSSDTSVLIVSDAGAAQGYRSLPRIQATSDTVFHLKHHTSLIAWLNPIPRERWSGSSAQIIAHLLPMRQMDLDGFTSAIDILRGQPFHHERT